MDYLHLVKMEQEVKNEQIREVANETKQAIEEARVTTDECLWCGDPIVEPGVYKKKEYQACDKYCAHDLFVMEKIERQLGILPPLPEVFEEPISNPYPLPTCDAECIFSQIETKDQKGCWHECEAWKKKEKEHLDKIFEGI